MLIQVLICFAIALLLIFVLVGKQTNVARAWKKVVFAGFLLLMLIAVIFPEVTTWLAGIVGVGRGADLLLYGLALAFVGYVLNEYSRRHRDRDMVVRLSRKIALIDAAAKYDLDKEKK